MIPPVLVLVAYLGAARKIAREAAADVVERIACATIDAFFWVELQALGINGRVAAWARPEEPPTGPDPWDDEPAPRPVPAPAAVASPSHPMSIAPEARRSAPTALHYVRDYERTVCGGPVHGASRATGSATVWDDEPEASRCGDCAAQMGGAS